MVECYDFPGILFCQSAYLYLSQSLKESQEQGNEVLHGFCQLSPVLRLWYVQILRGGGGGGGDSSPMKGQ